MKLKLASLCTALGFIALTTACSGSAPLQPTNGSVSGSSNTAVTSSTTPLPVGPADGAQILFASQPVTLTIKNAVSTSSAAQTYTYDVATDAGFATIVYTKSGVAAGTSGQTALIIDKLKPATTYYWRSRVVTGSTTGPASATKSFVVGPEVILQAAALASPAQNSTTGVGTLTVANVQKTGPAGTITYQFDLSDSSSFSKIVFTAKVTEQAGGQTSANATAQLTSGTTYFWRVQATDSPSGVSSPVSSTFSFKFVSFDPSKAIFLDNPADVGSWPQTATITSVNFTNDAILVDFDRREGPNRWPDAGFGGGSIEYTLGMCFNLGGQWYCSAAIQFWNGRDLEASGLPSEIAINWYYDSRWGAMQGHQPAEGEQIAIWVGSGNLRDSGNTYKERSDFVIMPFGGSYNR